MLESDAPKYHLTRKSYPRAKLQKIFDDNGFSAINKQLEDARCEADLMYAIFNRPHIAIPTLLKGFLEIIEKKNTPKLGQSKMYRDAVSFMTENPRADNRAKIYFVLLIINREPEAQEFIEASYLPQHPGNIWENDYKTHFKTFSQTHLPRLVESAHTSAFGAGNIIEFVRSFVLCAKQLYLSK